MVISNENKQYDTIDMLMTILKQFIKALFMITSTQQIVWSIVSRQPIADQSPTSCRPIATHFQSVGNQSPTSRRPVLDWSPTFRDSCRQPVADWSATEKNAVLIARWLHWLRLYLVARQSPTGCSTCVTGALDICFWLKFSFSWLHLHQAYIQSMRSRANISCNSLKILFAPPPPPPWKI